MLCVSLAACTIEVGPPPESDPPLVSEAEKRPPPPKQPSEPQPWSRDLDFEAGPTRIDRNVLTEGLVAEESEVTYSRERLTYESAFNPDKPPSEAELARQRAIERAKAAGLPPPPEVAAAPVSSVSAESLPPGDGSAAPPQPRESRLPPPPKFPPLPPKEGEAAEAANAETATDTSETSDPADEAWAKRNSRLPAPPKFPPLPPKEGETAEAGSTAPEAEGAAGTETAAAAGEAQGPVDEAWAKRNSRLPAPPKIPPLPAEAQAPEAPGPEAATAEAAASEAATGEASPPEPAAGSGSAAGATQLAAAAQPEAGDAETAAFLAEAWDAPSGTILVQVSAVPQKTKVLDEWARLRARYPQVLEPLRLVVDEARLGEKRVFYRVQAGAFGTEAGATAACDALISQGQNCFVLVR